MASRQRWALTALGTVTVVLGGVALVDRFLPRTTSTPVPVSEAHERFERSISTTVPIAREPAVSPAPTASPVPVATVPAESSTTTAPPEAPAEPLVDPGVYVYATTGRDEVDALGGAHHDYPATTTITVTPSGCGVVQRWDVLVERWEEWQRCPQGGGVLQVGRTTSDRFFEQTQTDVYGCTGQPRPLDAPAGTTWTTTCTQGDTSEVHHGVVVGTETLAVGDSPVETMHVSVSITTDRAGDSQVTDTWYLAGGDLVIAQTAAMSTSNDTVVGLVVYTENYEIHLTSLTPIT